MRRRQILAQKASPPEKAVEAVLSVPKGTCPICKKHIGRGVTFHAKGCKG